MNALVEHIVSRLATVYPTHEAEELAYWIIEETTGMNRFEARSSADAITIPNLDGIIGQLCDYVPIQYIFGHTIWLGLDLKVTPATLIPRPETAELVELISHQPSAISRQHPLRLLDIGTGCGCIALAIKQRHPEWQVTGIDISADAIAVARANARRNNLDVTFRQADIFSDDALSPFNFQFSPFNLIVSNPPYIRPSESSTMTRNTLRYEPHDALFVPDNDPLLFYRRIAELHRAPELWFEISETQGEQILTLMQQTGYEAQCLKDMYGKQRFIHATDCR
ncbi:MAG: peptide chain release factor N(5)-glutamine methyltransferase [Paludibacteraceae bacterium]|nr:peptide chain release factor N(5)-glutamine methyltransferase [Paludibacteraceae bacterium]